MISLKQSFLAHLFKVLTLVITLVITLYAQLQIRKPDADKTFLNDTENKLSNTDLTILYLPMNNINVSYINKTKVVTKKEFSDSFFVEAANDLINYECSKNFAICSYFEGFEELKDSIILHNRVRYSVLKKDTTEFDSVSNFIKSITKRFKVDLVCIPYSCKMKHVIFQQKGWRESPNTARPIKYRAETEVHLQIWDDHGKLLYEKIGKDKTKRPILYSLFKRKKSEKDKDIATYASRFFAPPLIKSLSSSITSAMNIPENE